MHLVYGSLRNALHPYVLCIQATGEGQERSPGIARTVAGMQLLRAWLGWTSTRPGVVEGLIPTGKVREKLLAEAETRLGMGFSESQRSCILNRATPITNWSFVAGDGLRI